MRTAPNVSAALLICACAFTIFGQSSNPPYPPPGKMVEVDGRKLHLNCTGAGAPAAIITGAGYSFDWALVQPQVARFTRVCTYDPSGTAWSDPGPAPTCANRASELHQLLAKAGISEPMVLVGLSAGALVARYYAAQYPSDVSGMVFVDHAFLNPGFDPPPPAATPTQAGRNPMTLTLEDISDFNSLPLRSRELHKWAAARHPANIGLVEAEQCVAELNRIAGDVSDPLGNLPLVVISTANQTPGYSALQGQLLNLSHRSKQLLAAHSFHGVEIDQPDVVVRAIRDVVNQIRTTQKRD